MATSVSASMPSLAPHNKLLLSGLSGPIGPCGAPEPRWVAVDGLATRSSHGPWEMAIAEQ